MEQVFDFRDFLLTLLRKCKLILVLALVFALLGAAFGFIQGGGEKYTTTSGGSVNLAKKTLETSPLSDTMKNIDSVITDNYFYTGLIDAIKDKMTPDHYDELIKHNKRPTLDDLKTIIKVYTKGNLILLDVTAGNQALTQEASRAGIGYAIAQVKEYNRNVVVTPQAEQTFDVKEQEGSSRKSEMLKYGILGLGGGIVVAILWIFFVGVFDLRVKSAEDLKKYRLPILGELSQE